MFDEDKTEIERDKLYARILSVIKQVPAGNVATYGQIALVAGASNARMIGRILKHLPDGTDVPWHRILNSGGTISVRGDGGPSLEQSRRLKDDGVFITANGKVNFREYGWSGPDWFWLEEQGYDIEELALRSQQKPKTGAWVNWSL
jgi:methylated-DNA-protein-cysteine methyltransferase related protein